MYSQASRFPCIAVSTKSARRSLGINIRATAFQKAEVPIAKRLGHENDSWRERANQGTADRIEDSITALDQAVSPGCIASASFAASHVRDLVSTCRQAIGIANRQHRGERACTHTQGNMFVRRHLYTFSQQRGRAGPSAARERLQSSISALRHRTDPAAGGGDASRVLTDQELKLIIKVITRSIASSTPVKALALVWETAGAQSSFTLGLCASDGCA